MSNKLKKILLLGLTIVSLQTARASDYGSDEDGDELSVRTSSNPSSPYPKIKVMRMPDRWKADEEEGGDPFGMEVVGDVDDSKFSYPARPSHMPSSPPYPYHVPLSTSFPLSGSFGRDTSSSSSPFRAFIRKKFDSDILEDLDGRFPGHYDVLCNHVDYDSWKEIYENSTGNKADAVTIVTWLNNIRKDLYDEEDRGAAIKVVGAIDSVILKIFGGCWGIREVEEDDDIDGLRGILNSTISSAVETNTNELEGQADSWARQAGIYPEADYKTAHYNALVTHYALIANDHKREVEPKDFEVGEKFSISLEHRLNKMLVDHPNKAKLISIIKKSAEEKGVTYLDGYLAAQKAHFPTVKFNQKKLVRAFAEYTARALKENDLMSATELYSAVNTYRDKVINLRFTPKIFREAFKEIEKVNNDWFESDQFGENPLEFKVNAFTHALSSYLTPLPDDIEINFELLVEEYKKENLEDIIRRSIEANSLLKYIGEEKVKSSLLTAQLNIVLVEKNGLEEREKLNASKPADSAQIKVLETEKKDLEARLIAAVDEKQEAEGKLTKSNEETKDALDRVKETEDKLTNAEKEIIAIQEKVRESDELAKRTVEEKALLEKQKVNELQVKDDEKNELHKQIAQLKAELEEEKKKNEDSEKLAVQMKVLAKQLSPKKPKPTSK